MSNKIILNKIIPVSIELPLRISSLLVLPANFPKKFGLNMEFLSFRGISQGMKNLLVSPRLAVDEK